MSLGKKIVHFSEFLSNGIGLFTIGITCALYVVNIIEGSFENFTKIAFASIGILGALSAISFSYASSIQSEEKRWAPFYAGEKFFHSCILITQAVLLSFASYSLENIAWFNKVKLLSSIIQNSITIIRVLVTISAFYCAYWGFEAINEQLWKRWRTCVK